MSQIYQKNISTRRLPKSELAAPSDAVRLSEEGREIQAALQAVSSADDIRPVADDIRAKVQAGTYQVSSSQIAAALLQKLGTR